MKGDLNKVRQSITDDSNFYNAGFSINAEKRKLKGNIEWGHSMTPNDLYFKKFDGISLQDLIWNWINGSGPTKYINNNWIYIFSKQFEIILIPLLSSSAFIMRGGVILMVVPLTRVVTKPWLEVSL